MLYVMSKKAARKPPAASNLTKQRENKKTSKRRLVIVLSCAAILAGTFTLSWGLEQWRVSYIDNLPSIPNGGWIFDNDSEFDERADICDIERFDSMSKDEFDESFRLRSPFILTNVTDRWRNVVFSKAYMQEQYGSYTVLAGISKEIPQQSGNGYEPMSLNDALAKMALAQKVKDDPLYIFDQNGFFESAKELKNEIKLPPPFAESEEGHNLEGDITLYLALGGSSSGVQFHKHADGWNVQIFGKKRWLLYPPNK
jgi:hypothetical protein